MRLLRLLVEEDMLLSFIFVLILWALRKRSPNKKILYICGVISFVFACAMTLSLFIIPKDWISHLIIVYYPGYFSSILLWTAFLRFFGYDWTDVASFLEMPLSVIIYTVLLFWLTKLTLHIKAKYFLHRANKS